MQMYTTVIKDLIALFGSRIFDEVTYTRGPNRLYHIITAQRRRSERRGWAGVYNPVYNA